MYSIRIFFVGCLLVYWTQVHGQSSYKLGFLPSVNMSFPVASGWKVNTKIELREVGIRGDAHVSETQLEFELLDLSAIVNKKFGSRNSIGVGYLVRIYKDETVHRSIQQFAFGSGHGVISIAHRVSADQTFRPSEHPEYRLRYRIGAEIPLNGESVDPREFYLKCTNEYLGILQSSDTDLEIRALGVVGFNINKNSKVEAGPEYRVSGFLNQKARHVVWLSLGSFLSF